VEDPPPSLLALDTYLLSRVGKIARARTGDRLADRGLRLWHLSVLATLGDDGPAGQRELGLRLRIDPSDLVKVLDELERAGAVHRERDPADRRRSVVSLTGTGRALLLDLTAEAAQVADDLLAPLPEAQRAQLHRALLALFHHATGTPPH
jgi:MarR family transcriptional regulator, lower aerobic nicotinate degradation pathway regulator